MRRFEVQGLSISWDEDTSEDIQPQSQTAQKTFLTYTYSPIPTR